MSMRKFGIFMLILCTALLCCGAVFAATYYCDSVNGDNNGDGSAANPWINFDGFVNTNVLQPGDTVIFKDGTYEGAPANGSGFTIRPTCEGVTFKAENKGGATIVHTSFCENNPGILNFDVNVDGVSCTFDGFNFSNASAGIRIAGGKMVEVKNCYFTGMIHNNEVHPRTAAIYLEGRGLVDFHNNEVAYLSAGDDMACVAMDNYAWEAPNAGDSTSKYYNNLFHDFYNDSNGQMGGTGFWVRGATGGVQIFNNTFVNVKRGILSENQTRTLATNNIFYYCEEVALSGNCVSSHNLFYGCGTNYNGCSGGPGDVNADPLFVDSMSDFNLAYGSPAVNAGADMGLPYVGNAPDMGCFESEYTDSEFGTLTGTVTDANGDPISGMKVFVSAESFGYTGADGTYSFPLDPGSYTVDVIGAGYDRSSNTVNVNIQRGATSTANFTMTKAQHTFYVSPYGDNDNPGTQDEPWATPDNGDKKLLLAPGDKVIIQEGEYIQEEFRGFTISNCSGTAAEPIVYEAEEGAVLNGEYFIYSSYPNLSEVPRLFGIKVSNVVIKGLELANFNVAFYVGGATGLSGIVIDGCDIHGGNAWSGLAPACAGLYLDPTHNSVEMKNCRIHDFPDWAAFMDMTNFWDGDQSSTATLNFHHNYVYNISGNGTWIRGHVNDNIYNNTFYNVTGAVINADWNTQNYCGNPNVKNNIFANCGTAMHSPVAVTNSNNLIFNTNPVSGAAVMGADTLTSDPMFTDAANGDFSISELSPAVNAGVDVGYAFIGPRPDIGAYETEVAVSKTGKISGTVTGTYNGNSYPVGGITVTAGEFSATTANDGSFLMAVPVGSYTVSAVDSARFTCGSGSVNVTVTPDSEETANFTGEIFMATYYVATDGDDDNDGSEANPWATITNGDHKKILQPGDTVIVKEGEYVANGFANDYACRLIECDGTAEFPITYKAQGEVKLINDGSGNPNKTALTCCLHVSDNYIVLDGFDFQGGAAALLTNHKAAGLVVKNCKMHDTDYITTIWPQSCGIYQEAANGNITVENCEIYNIGLDCTGEGYGIYNMGGYFGSEPGAQATYHHNYIHNVVGGALCVRGGQTNDLFYNNTAVDCTAYGVTTAGGATLGGTVTAKNNIFVACGTALRIESPACTVTNSNNLIYNCGTPSNTTLGEGTIQDDPDFTDEPVISDESPAVNNGVDVGLEFKGVAPDMGCYETDVQNYLTGTVIVTVTTSDLGAPAVGVAVNCGDASAVTDSNGVASFAMRPGTYTVDVFPEGAYSYSGDSKSVTVTVGSTENLEFVVDHHCTTYYVSLEGSDDNDGLTPETAWYNINVGDRLGVLVPGDTVIVMEGHYTGDTGEMSGYYESRYGYRLVQCAGSEYYPITYKAQGNVVISNELGVTAQGMAKAISVSAQYIILDGFEVTGAETNQGIYFDYQGFNDTVKNCYVHDLGPTTAIWPRSAGAYIEGGMTTPSTTVFENCTFANIGDAAGWSYGLFDMGGFWVYQGGCQPEMHHCTFYNIGGAALCARGGLTNAKFYNNTVYNCRQGVAICNGSTSGGSADMQNNIFYGCSDSDVGAESQGVVVAYNNNMTFNCGRTAAGAIVADPLFVDAANYDFNLTQASPAIDAGVDLGYEYKFNAPDLGAYESEFEAAAQELDAVSDLADVADGTLVQTTFDLIAVNGNNAFGDGSVYGETADRLAGVKFDFSNVNQAVAAGDAITVKGIVKSDADGKYIEVKEVLSQTAGDELGALGLTNVSLDTNVLVRVWGKVVSKADGTFVINNGMGDITVKGATTAAVGDFVTATGVATKTGVKALEVL